MLRKLGEEPAARSANPVTLVASFVVNWKEIGRIRAERERQRGEVGEMRAEDV